LLSSAHNATYLSPTIQNEITDACNDLISGELVRKVNAARCFSVLADVMADVSGVEQFSLCVRYMDLELGKGTEDFLGFVPVYDLPGKGLAQVLVDSLCKRGIDMQY